MNIFGPKVINLPFRHAAHHASAPLEGRSAVGRSTAFIDGCSSRSCHGRVYQHHRQKMGTDAPWRYDPTKVRQKLTVFLIRVARSNNVVEFDESREANHFIFLASCYCSICVPNSNQKREKTMVAKAQQAANQDSGAGEADSLLVPGGTSYGST